MNKDLLTEDGFSVSFVARIGGSGYRTLAMTFKWSRQGDNLICKVYSNEHLEKQFMFSKTYSKSWSAFEKVMEDPSKKELWLWADDDYYLKLIFDNYGREVKFRVYNVSSSPHGKPWVLDVRYFEKLLSKGQNKN